MHVEKHTETGFTPPHTLAETKAALKVGKSRVLGELAAALHAWGPAKLAADYAAIYGNLGDGTEAAHRHGIGAWVSALYHGLDVPAPVDPEAISEPMRGFLRQVLGVRLKRAALPLERARAAAQDKAQRERTQAARKRERQARKQARR